MEFVRDWYLRDLTPDRPRIPKAESRKRSVQQRSTPSEDDEGSLNTNSTKKTKLIEKTNPSLLDLPFEVRMIIYCFLFQGARIVLEPSSSPWSHRVKICHEAGSARGLLASNKAIYKESLPVLQKATIVLRVSPWSFRWQDQAVISSIPDEWRDCVKIIQYHDHHPRLRLFLPHYTNLEIVSFGPRVYHIEEREKPKENDVAEIILGKIEKKDAFLIGHGEKWIIGLPKISVIMTALLVNRRKQESIGWAAQIDTVNWRVLYIVQAKFTRVPFDESQVAGEPLSLQEHARRRWNNGADAWKVEIVE